MSMFIKQESNVEKPGSFSYQVIVWNLQMPHHLGFVVPKIVLIPMMITKIPKINFKRSAGIY